MKSTRHLDLSLAASLMLVGCVSTTSPPGTQPLDQVLGENQAFISPSLSYEINPPAFQSFSTEDFFNEYADDPAVKRWTEYFSVRVRSDFSSFIQRGRPYKSMIRGVLKQQNIPEYFFYLAMIESGFKQRAKSHMGASGLWQFMPATARRYGLNVNHVVDERLDPVRSTYAAASYLHALNNVFHSWFLAMSAYNAGEARIMGAIMRSGSRDFWELVKRKALPPETREYIPKFIAAVLVGQNPEKYGIKISHNDQIDFTAVKSAAVPSPISLKTIAASSGIALETLKFLNPHLLRGITPAQEKTYRIWIPTSTSVDFVASLKPESIKSESIKGQHYRVRKGDTLALIAKRTGTSVRSLKQVNRLRSNHLKLGQKLLVSNDQSSLQTLDKEYTSYRVKRGENLKDIARKFGMSVEDLKDINDLRVPKISVGQVLRVGARG